MKSFVTFQIRCCQLLWMFHSRRLNNKITSIYERALKITYQDHIPSFHELLSKDNFLSMHHRILQVLATAIFKNHKGFSSDILREICESNLSLYNLCWNNTFERRQVPSVYHCTETLSFLDGKICDLVPLKRKQLERLQVFKIKIKNGFPLNVLADCVERICRNLAFCKV